MGYKVVRQKGSHFIFSNGEQTFPVPHHGSKDISPGIEKQLLKILGVSIAKFRSVK